MPTDSEWIFYRLNLVILKYTETHVRINFQFSLAVATCAVALGAVAPGTAVASEGETFGGPIGGTDMRSAYIPWNSGWYMGTVVAGGFANRDYGDNDKPIPGVTAQGYSWVGALGLSYVYPFKIFGGSVSSGGQLGYYAGRFKINGTFDSFRDLGDSYVQLLGWSKYIGPIGGEKPSTASSLPYGLTVKAAYSMIFPIGNYTPNKDITIGHNVYFFIPNFAFTYLTRPNFLGDGLEFSSAMFFDFASKNNHTNYSTGLVGDIDFAVTERMGNWQAGLAGYYAQQWQQDIQNGMPVAPNGKKLFTLALGPVVAYDIPKWHASVKLKVTLPVAQGNGLNTTRVILIFNKAL